VDYLSLLPDQLEILSSRHHAKFPLIIVSGDFNILHINWDINTASTANGSSLLTILDDFHLQQLVDDPLVIHIAHPIFLILLLYLTQL